MHRSPMLFLVAVFVVGCAEHPLRVVETDALVVATGKKNPPGKRNDIAVDVTFADAAGDKISSDARFGAGGSTYAHDACGVSAVINESSQDLTFHSASGVIRRKEASACAGSDPRTVHFELDDPVDGGAPSPSHPLDVQAFLNTNDLGAIVTSAETRAQFNIGPCDRLVFDPNEFADTDPVEVTQVSPTQWAVVTTGAARGRCVDEGRTYRLPFALIVVAR